MFLIDYFNCYVPEVDEYTGATDEVAMRTSGSQMSEMSWTSDDAYIDDTSRESMEFMRDFVNKVFDEGMGLNPLDKAKFGELVRHMSGRLWFARCVSAMRVNHKRVSELTFYQLVQYFALCLFECSIDEDYVPAKNLMNMCFTFYYQVQRGNGPVMKHFLYSYLKDQPIWQSLRFWNAAFFDAVQKERATKCPPNAKDRASALELQKFQENIVFGQLGTFTCNMRSFGLSKELVLEFIRKQSTEIAHLKEEQINMLRENAERMADKEPPTRYY